MALRQLAELLHKHPEVELPAPRKGPLEGCEGWRVAAGPVPVGPGDPGGPHTGTTHTVTIGQPGRKRFARTGRQDIRPTRIIPLRQAAEGDETLRVAEIRAIFFAPGVVAYWVQGCTPDVSLRRCMLRAVQDCVHCPT